MNVLFAAAPYFSDAWPAASGLRLWMTRFLNAMLACSLASAVVCATYLCKCKMGIDIFEGPSFLHKLFYWMIA